MRHLALISTLGLLWGCVDTPSQAQAFRVTQQEDLIGGTAALGEVGDYMLRNSKLRVIIQDVGFSRGFAVYGGSLIDADIRRPRETATAVGGNGNDRFAELFPAFLLEAAEPTKITVRNDGSDGKAARIIITAKPGQFLTLVNLLNDVMLGPEDLGFVIEYSLGPNDRFVTIKSTLRNLTAQPRRFPKAIIGGVPFSVPIGHVALMGNTNRTFVPGLPGFDIRFTLPEINKANPRHLPALPGLTAEFVATQNDGVSYGVFTETNEADNFAWRFRDSYGPETTPSMLEIPFIFSSFLGYYYSIVPDIIQGNEEFTAVSYFAVGRGDVADIRDIVHEQRHDVVGRFSGRVLEADTLKPMANADIVVSNGKKELLNQHTTNENGDFTGTLPPGDYFYQVVSNRYPLQPYQAFTVTANQTTQVDVFVQPTAYLSVQVTEPGFNGVPCKIILEGTYDYIGPNPETRKFLFDLRRGERRRIADRVTDTEDPATRKYLENQYFVANGRLGERVRPGKYTLYVSRGLEYEVFKKDIELKAGQTTEVGVTLQRAFNSEGWMSGDFHLHSSNSIDSGTLVRDRVIGVAAEGVDIAVSTDHNFITDYAPHIQDLNLQYFLAGMVGVEMTTLEVGHFNGYPLKTDLTSANRGAFSWFNRPAQEIFDDMRALGKYGPNETVVQVNHPRDTIMGYFNQLNVDADTGIIDRPNTAFLQPSGIPFRPDSFSTDFDALEIFNGKRFDMLRSLKAPNPLPPGSPAQAVAGEVLRKPDGTVAVPGAVDDWFRMLNLGHRFTAIGDSDSHSNSFDEPGYPRTYVHLGVDTIPEVHDLEVARAIKRHETTITNGPFVELWASDTGIGGQVKGGKHIVKVRVRKASWVHVDTVNLWVNGVMEKTLPLVDAPDEYVQATMTFARDSYVVAEVTGNTHSLWPVVTPIEEPPLTVLDAVGELGSSFGLESAPLGPLTPDITHPVYPYAITSPIWIDADSNDTWTPPGNPSPLIPAREVKEFKASAPNDIRVLFNALHEGPH